MRGSARPPIFPSWVLGVVTSTMDRWTMSLSLKIANWMPTSDSVSELCKRDGISDNSYLF